MEVLCLTSGVSATGSYLQVPFLCKFLVSCSIVHNLQVPVVVVLSSGVFGSFFGYFLDLSLLWCCVLPSGACVVLCLTSGVSATDSYFQVPVVVLCLTSGASATDSYFQVPVVVLCLTSGVSATDSYLQVPVVVLCPTFRCLW